MISETTVVITLTKTFKVHAREPPVPSSSAPTPGDRTRALSTNNFSTAMDLDRSNRSTKRDDTRIQRERERERMTLREGERIRVRAVTVVIL